MIRPPFPPRVLRDLDRSGLDRTDARKMQIKARSDQYRLPYFDLDGTVNGFYRDRFVGLALPRDKHGKRMRYTQPSKMSPRLYLPPLGVDWTKIAADPSIELLVTEGEKKSAAACKLGIPTIGLGGVWNWKSKESKGRPIPDFNLITWRGRRVKIAFDSDTQNNPEIQRAQRELSAELLKRGAHPVTIKVPQLAGQEKTGLDDYIVAKGEKAFRSLLRGRQPLVQIDGAALLDSVHQFLGRFISHPSADAHVAHTLWIAHTHLMHLWDSTPRIAFLSPEKETGKTRALELTETLVPRACNVMNASVSYIFRKVSGSDGGLPTILYDEIDTLFGPQAKGNEEVRGLVNAGHRRGALVGRTVARGDVFTAEEWPVYCALALAGIGNLPDTILSRSVIIRMRRRSPTESIEPYRPKYHEPEGHALRDKLAAWAERIAESMNTAPELPPSITDRAADCWESLLAVADAAGGTWPERARVAAVAHVALARGTEGQSLGVRLLADLKRVFGKEPACATYYLLKCLNEDDEAPWGDLKGKPLDPHRLARMLKQYGIHSRNVRINDKIPKGYAREDFVDSWNRYVPTKKLKQLKLEHRDNPTPTSRQEALQALQAPHRKE